MPQRIMLEPAPRHDASSRSMRASVGYRYYRRSGLSSAHPGSLSHAGEDLLAEEANRAEHVRRRHAREVESHDQVRDAELVPVPPALPDAVVRGPDHEAVSRELLDRERF